MSTYTIGRLAKAAGVSVETVRYYERRGLIPQPMKPADSGWRRYSEEHLKILQFIRRSQRLGFSLDEIGDLLQLREDRGRACDEVLASVQLKRREISAKLRDLQALQSALEGLARRCEQQEAPISCPILEALEDGGELIREGGNEHEQ